MARSRTNDVELSDVTAAPVTEDPLIGALPEETNISVLAELGRFMERVSAEGVETPTDLAILNGAKHIFGSLMEAADKITEAKKAIKKKATRTRTTKKKTTKKKTTKKKASKKKAAKKTSAKKKTTKKKATKKKATKKRSTRKKATKKTAKKKPTRTRRTRSS